MNIHWCNGETRGTLELMENGCRQAFELPLALRRRALFTHFSCRADGQAVSLEKTLLAPARSIVAFLDVSPANATSAAQDAAPEAAEMARPAA
jgi:hypothetical protein